MSADPFEVKERHREKLMRLPNVTGVGVSRKVVDGKPTDGLAIKVYVSKKVEKEQLAEGECVPEEIEGIRTDVEVLDRMRAR